MVQIVAESLLLGVFATADHVEQQPAFREALKGGRLLGGQGGRDQSRPERHQELESLGLSQQCGGGQPGVLAKGPGRRENALVPQSVDGTCDFGQVAPVRRTVAGGNGVVLTGV